MNIATQYSSATSWNGSFVNRSGQNRQAFSVPTEQIQPVNDSNRKTQGKSLLDEPLFKHRHGNTITLDDLKAEARDSKAAFQTQFMKALTDVGIDASQPIILESDAQGKVRVANNVPNKAAIEKILQDSPELTNEYHRADANASIIAAAEKAKTFQKAYAQNPQAAVTQYSYLFAGKKDE